MRSFAIALRIVIAVGAGGGLDLVLRPPLQKMSCRSIRCATSQFAAEICEDIKR